jgi:Fe-S cluster assembly protein SufD
MVDCPDRLSALESDHFAGTEWFAALQASAPQDGGAVLIPDGVTLDKPVFIHHHLSAGTHVAQPQHLVVVGKESRAEVIVWTTTDADADGLYNGAITADLGEHAYLGLEIVQDEHGDAHHIGHHQFRQAASSKLEVRTATARAHWLRNDLHILQGGQYGDSTFHGCYLPNERQFVDHHTRIDHAMPDGRSDELYKGLAAGSATAVFNGKIMVHQDAQRIEAYQSNANLILGEQAAINAKPELEIYADDVRCSHGCTTGQFDGEALFYLRSRGMTETAARNLLVRAFLAEVLDGFRREIQAHVESIYAERLGWN